MRFVPPALVLVLAVAGGAAAGPARVRVWAATRLELAGREATDEAGARWVDARGRLVTDRGEPVGGVEVRFVRGDEVVRATTAADGSFHAALRASGAGWTARFDGGERLRPSSAPVPAGPTGAGGRPWIVFVPLLALGGALAAGAAVLLARRARGALARLAVFAHRAFRVRRPVPRRPEGDGGGGPRARRLRVIDALRGRPLPGARLERGPASAAAVLALADGDGVLEWPAAASPAVVRAAGYVAREVGAAPASAAPTAAEDPAGIVALLRGRDAVIGWLEAVRRSAGPPPSPLETVARMAERGGPPGSASLLAAVCYGRPRAPGERTCAVLDALHARVPASAAAADPSAVAEALGSEPGAATPSAPRG